MITIPKRIPALLLSLALLSLAACADAAAPVDSETARPAAQEPAQATEAETEAAQPLTEATPPTTEETQPPATETATETTEAALLSDEEILGMFVAMEAEACLIADWYLEENREALGVTDEPGYAPYYKVGIMDTVDEMRAAMDALFTEGFTAAYFYDHAFEDPGGNAMPMYKEIAGALYRNADQGGMGWPHGLEGTQSVAYRDESTIIIGARTYLPGGETDWTNFLLRKEGGVWKFDVFYSFNRYMLYSDAYERQREDEISHAASSWLAAVDWTDPNQLSANSLINLYEYFYLQDVDLSLVEDYDTKGYPVSSAELLDGLSIYLNGLKKETLTLINLAEGTSAYYDEATDTFYFEIMFDTADFLVTGMEKNGDVTTLTIMVIAKNGKASYESLLDLEADGSDVTFVGNRKVRSFTVD